jgi:hypothetical protein
MAGHLHMVAAVKADMEVHGKVRESLSASASTSIAGLDGAVSSGEEDGGVGLGLELSSSMRTKG